MCKGVIGVKWGYTRDTGFQGYRVYCFEYIYICTCIYIHIYIYTDTKTRINKSAVTNVHTNTGDCPFPIAPLLNQFVAQEVVLGRGG